jgi:hypothetical protein
MNNKDVQVGSIVKCNGKHYTVKAMKWNPEDPVEPFFELEPVKQISIWRQARDLESI